MIWGLGLFHDLSAARGRWACCFSLWLLQQKLENLLLEAWCWLQTPSFPCLHGQGFPELSCNGQELQYLTFPLSAGCSFSCLQEEPAGTWTCHCWKAPSEWVLQVQDSPARLSPSLERILCVSESSYKIWQFGVVSIGAGVGAPAVLLVFCGGSNSFIENVQIFLG